MAGLRCNAKTVELALVAATAKTILQLAAPAQQRVLIRRWGVFFDGVAADAEPVEVRLLRQTTAGTMSANTPVKLVAGSETIQTAATDDASAEPTPSDVLDVIEVHPQGGFDAILPPDQVIEVPGGTRVGIECTAPAGVNVRSKIWFEE